MTLSISKLAQGVNYRLKKIFQSPYSVFNINKIEEIKLKHSKSNVLQTHKYKKDLIVTFKDSVDFLYTVKELFIDEIYKFTPTVSNPYIIDCGSYIGSSILYFKTTFPNATVIGFEPDSKNYNILKTNLENWNFTNTTAVNAAIWIHNGSTLFNSLGNMGSSIELSNKVKENENSIKCVRLKDLLNQKVDFLKLDIEGAEYETIMDCKEELNLVENIFIEYHGNFNENHKLISLFTLLHEKGFKFYIKEAANIFPKPFTRVKTESNFEVQLNIFGFRS
jgi:FkbM family methyltransferase